MPEGDAPFRVGDRVIYAPSERGIGLTISDPIASRLVPGQEYRVAELQQGQYVVVQGHTHPGGGLHWSEFRRAS
jgi:hypothetical protein